MVQQRAPLHLLLRQRRIGERVRTGGDDERRGGTPDIPRNLRQRVHVLQRALEHRHPQEFLPERAEVAEGDRGRGQDGVERRDLLADEVVFGLCVERGLVCPEVVVPPPRALDVQRRWRDGHVCWCMSDCGHDGGGKGKACCGRVEVQERGLSFCGCISWWWLWSILARNHWSVRAGCVIFHGIRAWSVSSTGAGFGFCDARL